MVKKHRKIIALVTILVVLILYVVVAGQVAFDGYIQEWQEEGRINQKLTVGEEFRPGAAIWVEDSGRCYSSNPDCAVVNKTGEILAVAPGEAYVVYLAIGDMHKVVRVEVTGGAVVDAAAVKSHGSTANSIFTSNLKLATARLLGEKVEVFGKVIIILCIWLVICVARMGIRIWKLEKETNEENARALAEFLKSRSRFSKILIYSNMYKFGIRRDMFRELFNHKVNPDPEITGETKQELSDQLKSLKVYGLDPVRNAPPIDDQNDVM